MAKAEPIVVIGAGPAGLSAGMRLEELGADWQLVEGRKTAGGLSASFQEDGYTWDLGGHVFFSRFPEYEEFLDGILPPDGWVQHHRRALVRACGAWVPYPFQYNLWALPNRRGRECLEGLIELRSRNVEPDSSSFQSFIDTHFGRGVAGIFMTPYNRKVWGYPLDEMSADWLGERVATVDLERAVHSLEENEPDVSWGLNSEFRYPLTGGVGAVWRKAAERLPHRRVAFGADVVAVSASQRTVTLDDGHQLAWSHLISTMPLDRLVAVSDLDGLLEQAGGLRHSSLHVVFLGIESDPDETVHDACWMYFPEPDCPFHRATILSHYSPLNAPVGRWSLLLEVCETPRKPVDADSVVEQCVEGCVAAGLVASAEAVDRRWHRRIEYAYPTPTLDRDARLATVLPVLEKEGILSRGRFGAWRYELGNMDHAFMQGRQAAERIVLDRPESMVPLPRLPGTEATS